MFAACFHGFGDALFVAFGCLVGLLYLMFSFDWFAGRVWFVFDWFVGLWGGLCLRIFGFGVCCWWFGLWLLWFGGVGCCLLMLDMDTVG